jgi:hypothetical protein
MLPGNWVEPSAKPAQSAAPTAFIMFSQKMTDCASTVWPLRNFQPFRLIVTVLLPFDHCGAFANDKPKSTVGAALVGGPNQ